MSLATGGRAARGGGRGSLVDQGEAGLPVPREDLAHALEAHRHEVGIGVVVFLGELHRSIGELDALRQLPGHQRPERMEDGEPGVRWRIGLRFEQACSARASQPPAIEPAWRRKRLVRERQGDARGIARLAGVGVGGKGPFERLRGLRRAALPTRPPFPAARGRPAASPPSLSAATNTSIASAQACRSIASRPQLECLDHGAVPAASSHAVVLRAHTVNPWCRRSPALSQEQRRDRRDAGGSRGTPSMGRHRHRRHQPGRRTPA